MDPALFAFFLTAAGAVAAAAAIWAAIDFIKMSPLKGLVDGRERVAAFIGSALVVVLSLAVGLTEIPARYATATLLDWIGLAVIALGAFYGIGRAAMTIHDDVNKYPNSLTGPPQS